MQSQFNVTAFSPFPPASTSLTGEIAELLRQILEVQREQLAQMRATMAAHDPIGRWRALLSRWQQDFPELPTACRQVLPLLERAYGAIIAALVEELQQNGEDALDNDFALQDFLDRYGMRLAQLGNILNVVAPLAEAAAQNESASS
jgi:hypothetical protein